MKYTTRIAPSPTGDMHLGTARTAYFNWLAAKASGGKFILRIDDTDKNRNIDEAVVDILETMQWLGLDHDALEFQSSKQKTYKDMADILVANGLAVELDNGAIAFTIREPGHIQKSWYDEIAGDIPVTDTDIKNVEGMILIKGDGTPTYNFASFMDDVNMGVNFVIRGHDHLSNTSAQMILYWALGSAIPKFAHVGLIHKDKKKLSKRDGAASMLHYRNAGYDVDAMLNFMLRLGWGPTVDDKTTKMIDRDRAIELFLDGGKMRSAPSNMDINMLEAFDRKYKAKKGVWRNKDKLKVE